MSHTYDPWVDFRFGSSYASDYNLLRVSSSSRYNDNLIPTLNDKTADVPGGDGMYYFNSYYKQKQFNINFAFDGVTETNLRQIRNWLNGKEIKELVFDERPDRIYFAKVTGAPSFKYLPFDEGPRKSTNLLITKTFTNVPVRTTFDAANVANWPQDERRQIRAFYNSQEYQSVSFTKDTRNRYFSLFGPTYLSTIALPNTYPYGGGSSDIITFYDITYDDYQWLSRLFNFPAWETISGTTQVVYKGEGSVTFTCYDPFSYSEEITSAIGSSSEIAVDGDLRTNFTINVSGALPVNTVITLKDVSISPATDLTSLTILSENTNLTWNGRTGLVSDGAGAIKFTGNSMIMIEPTAVLALDGLPSGVTATITYRKCYY